ncbi:ATP-binding protein [Pseudomonas xanthosomatis]|uniref:ATP-binding protein n=1 Tax=Pseudomonas xanthosomatis TaxID=2842356 RepID=UPI0035116D3C
MKILATDRQDLAGAINMIHLAPEPGSVPALSASIAATDWSRTALGPLSHWPATLRIAVDMLQLSPFPCALVWGPELSVILNDSYPVLARQGCSFQDLWEEAWESTGAAVFQALEGRGGLVEDLPLPAGRQRGGAEARFNCYYSPIRDDRGEVAGFLHTMIAASANAEALREWQERAQSFEAQLGTYLADSEHTWQLSPDVMVVLDSERHVHLSNPAWQRTLGWGDDRRPEVSLPELLHPGERTEAVLALAALQNGDVASTFEARTRHADGYYLWFSWHTIPGQAMPTLVGREITETRNAAQRLAEAAVRESRRMESVVKVAGGLAHEMNNVLSGVGSSLELLERRLLQGRVESLESYVAMARECAERAIGLTHNLLAFARSQPLSPSALDVNRLMREAQPLMQQTLGSEMLLGWELDMSPWPVQLDPERLRTALLHLCANARDACQGRGKLSIRTLNERMTVASEARPGLPAGDYVTIQLEDDGHGMSAEDLAHAFEPFFTTKALGQGAGLGLPMVHGFVCQSGGQMWIESQIDQGARVMMMFPRYQGVLPEQADLTADPKPARGERLLLVDDEVNLRGLMKEALVERGYVVDDVSDANAALGQFRNAGPFELVITDIGLPGGFSGSQVARALRMIEPAQKILFITGFTGEPIEQAVLDQPGTALLRKPFSLETLNRQVQHMLRD